MYLSKVGATRTLAPSPRPLTHSRLREPTSSNSSSRSLQPAHLCPHPRNWIWMWQNPQHQCRWRKNQRANGQVRSSSTNGTGGGNKTIGGRTVVGMAGIAGAGPGNGTRRGLRKTRQKALQALPEPSAATARPAHMGRKSGLAWVVSKRPRRSSNTSWRRLRTFKQSLSRPLTSWRQRIRRRQ